MPEDPMAEEVTVETSDEETADDAGEEFAEGGDGFVEDESGSDDADGRSEEHTSELQSRTNLVCRLLLEKKKKKKQPYKH